MDGWGNKTTIFYFKQRLRRRDGYACIACGYTQQELMSLNGPVRWLDVHRLTPGSEYTWGGCVTLCRRCHRCTHNLLRAGQTPPGQMPTFALLAQEAERMAARKRKKPAR